MYYNYSKNDLKASNYINLFLIPFFIIINKMFEKILVKIIKKYLG